MVNALHFTATFEPLSSRRAIVTMFDGFGEWSGSGRVEIKARDRAALYEAAYRVASFNAASKGGRLERFVSA